MTHTQCGFHLERTLLVGIPDGSLCTIGGWIRESLVYTVIARPNGVSVAAIFGEYALVDRY